MDSQRRSQSPMGTSQRMGTARAIFDMPPELETNRRLTRSIRNTSNDPGLTETWKHQLAPQYDLKKPETDQFVFRNVQTYTPPEVQNQSMPNLDPAEPSTSPTFVYLVDIQIAQQPSVVTPQYDQSKPISYEVQQTTFKSSEFRPTDSYRPADFKQFDYKKPSEVNYEFQQPPPSYQRVDLHNTETTSYKPQQLTTDIYKTQQLTRQSDIQPGKFNPGKFNPPQTTNDQYKPEFYRPDSALPQQSYNPTASYKPDTFTVEQTRAATYKPTETFKSQTDNFQPTQSYKPSYRPETYKATDSYIATDAYKPKDGVLVQEKSKIAQENYKPESSYKAQSYKPDASVKQYDPQLSYLQKPVDEFIIVESPNTEHEFAAQCNIF